MGHITKKVTLFFVMLATFFSIFSVAFAATSLEVKCTIDGIDKTKVTIEAYDLTDIDQSITKKEASDILNYLQTNKINPNITGKFNKDGLFEITNADNKVWLIKAGDFTKNGIEYKAIPQIVDSSKIGSLEIVEAKYEFEIPKDSTVEYTVKKVWVDAKNLEHNAISVSLLHNGVIYDTVDLSKDNKWTYTWTKLSSDGEWTVQENKVPTGYVVSYSKSGNVFTVTNTSQTTFTPQTGLDSIEGRMIAISICMTIAFGTLIIGKYIKKKKQ